MVIRQSKRPGRNQLSSSAGFRGSGKNSEHPSGSALWRQHRGPAMDIAAGGIHPMKSIGYRVLGSARWEAESVLLSRDAFNIRATRYLLSTPSKFPSLSTRGAQKANFLSLTRACPCLFQCLFCPVARLQIFQTSWVVLTSSFRFVVVQIRNDQKA